MTVSDKKSKGWFLAMPYMRGERGIMVTRMAKIPAELRGCPHIFCGDILLGAADWQDYLADWFDALADGGRMALWVSDVRETEIPQDSQRLRLEHLCDALKAISRDQTILEYAVIDGHAFIVTEKRIGQAAFTFNTWCAAARKALVYRPGALGDALMASSILPGLKEQGFSITVMTRQGGHDMLRHDPHIDNFLILPPNAPLDVDMADFWAAWSPRFDRVVNLANTVEGAFLKRPHQADFWWPQEQRRALCTGSYLRLTHQAAQVAAPYRVKFYPTAEESEWAQKTKSSLGKFVLWALNGSAVHKWWPYTPQAVCQLLAKTDFQFVLSGDKGARDLESEILAAAKDYFGDNARIHSLVDARPARDVMALAQVADLVIGPETGVLNAVCREPMPKIVLLSHSAASNLTGDWLNATALIPSSPCYPCHRMHQNHDHCPQDSVTGAALCAASVPAAAMVDAVLSAVSSDHIHGVAA